MNFGIVLKVSGNILMIESALMIPSLLIAFYTNGSDKFAFLITILLSGILGFLMSKKKNDRNNISAREGLAIVSLSWIIASLFGALPFYLSGSIPDYIDAFFETVSGLTTTGATILSDVEALPLGTVFWRSFTHWIGGMGILVFTLALLPALGIGGFQIFKAESTGPIAGKIAPRVKDTAKILYMIYFSLTILTMIFLKIGGMSLFDSMAHAFATVGTGGFSVRNNSIAYYQSSYIHLVIGIFMVLSGVNFSLYYVLFRGKWKDAFKDEEMKFYLSIVAIAVIAIAMNLIMTNYKSIFLAFRDAFFQVSTIITTTGFSTVNYDLWPTFSKAILVLLMVIGGSAGSTAGGMKVIRLVILLKLIKREMAKIFHPRAFIPIKIGNKTIPNEAIVSTVTFSTLYIGILVISTILICLEGLDLVSAFTSVATTLGNVGIGLELIGPTRNFSGFSYLSKILFSFLMLLGRLEIFTMIALIAPKNWTKEA